MKTVHIAAEIPAYLHDAMEQLPGSSGKTPSDIVANALRDYVDANVPRLRELKAMLADPDDSVPTSPSAPGA